MLYMLLTLTAVVACYVGITGYACTAEQDWDAKTTGATGDGPPR